MAKLIFVYQSRYRLRAQKIQYLDVKEEMRLTLHALSIGWTRENDGLPLSLIFLVNMVFYGAKIQEFFVALI